VASARHNLPAEGDQPSDHPRQTAPFRGLIQRLNIVFGEHIPELGIQGVIDCILARVEDAKTYLTFDIDCLDPAFAPGTGTPVSGGLTSREALTILRRLGTLDIVGGDVMEVAPAYDHADITSLAGATSSSTT
jgi:agmatinase